MRKLIAALALGAVLVFGGTQLAQGQEGSPGAAPQPAPPPCVPIKVVYSEKHWEQAHPERGVNVCPVQYKAAARRTVQHFYLYRHYRKESPFHYGGEDKWLQWVPIPAAVVGCEGGTWDSQNDSGADGPAQMLGHQSDYGQPADVNSRSKPRVKVQYWDSVRDLYDDSGLDPWTPSESCWGSRV